MNKQREYKSQFLNRCICICFIFFLLSDSCQSQTKIYGGVSIPFSGFASNDSATGGFAKTGFAIGAEYDSKAFLGTEFGVSCLLGYYPINIQRLSENRLRLSPETSIESHPWLLIWPQISLGYQYLVSNSVTLFGKGLAGLFYGVYPEVTVVDAGVTRYTQNLSIKVAFGWGGGLGMMLNKKYNFEIRYLFSNPDYELNTAGESLLPTEISSINTQTLQLMVGYIF